MRINLDHQATDRIKIGTSTHLSNQVQNYGSDIYFRAVQLNPLAEPYDSEGNLVYRPGADPLTWNPLADYVDGTIVDERTRLRLFSNIFAEVDITENLSYRLNVGVDFWKYRQGLFF